MGHLFFIGRKIIEALCGRGIGVKTHGVFTFECFDKDGNLKWEKTAHNGKTNEGKNYMLDIFAGNEAQPSWYVGLIRNDNYTGLNVADTMASHGGWEEGDEYSETARQEITFAAASGSSIANTERCYFSINATEVMKGAFITNNNTKNGSSGKLFCTALFDGGDESVVNNDILKVTYTVTLS